MTNMAEILKAVEQLAREEEKAHAKALEWAAKQESSFQRLVNFFRENNLAELFLKDARSATQEEKEMLQSIRDAYFKGRGWSTEDEKAKARWMDLRRRVKRALIGKDAHNTGGERIRWKAQAEQAASRVKAAIGILADVEGERIDEVRRLLREALDWAYAKKKAQK